MITVEVNGKNYANKWDQVHIKKDLYACATIFYFGIKYSLPEDIKFEENSIVKIKYQDQLITEGPLKKHFFSLSDKQNIHNFLGYSYTGPLVKGDTSYNEYNDIAFSSLINEIVKQYNIKVDFNQEVQKQYKKYRLQGRNIWSELQELCTKENVYIYCNEKGGLSIGFPEEKEKKFVANKVRSIQGSVDYSNIPSQFQIRHQYEDKTQLYKEKNIDLNSFSKNFYTNITNDLEGENALDFISNYHNSHSIPLTVKYGSWGDKNNKVWKIGQQIKLDLPFVKVKDFVITAIEFMKDKKGSMTTLLRLNKHER